jgi:cytoskeletal protein CcmA (bactofilin family)
MRHQRLHRNANGSGNGLTRRILAVAFGILLTGGLAACGSEPPRQSEHEDVRLEGSYSDVQFLAGRTVQIAADVSDDVFAAGRNVTLDSATVRNAMLAGYDVEQRGGSAADMMAAGANVTVGGAVEDDLLAAGRSLRVSSGGTIGGDARAIAETIDMEGHIGGSLRAVARRITITGEIAGKADLLAERIVVTSEATIAGDLIYRSETEAEIAAGATIGGEVRRVEVDTSDIQSVGLAILGISLVIALVWAIATLILVAVVQLAFPGLMTASVGRLVASPWSHLGGGVVILLVATALAGGLLFSVLGIPLGLALLMATAILELLGLVAVGYCIGLFVSRRSPSDVGHGGRVGWALVGVVIIGLVTLIPFLGAIVAGLAVAAGAGAVGIELWRRLRS